MGKYIKTQTGIFCCHGSILPNTTILEFPHKSKREKCKTFDRTDFFF
jgi:hypothetical protein